MAIDYLSCFLSSVVVGMLASLWLAVPAAAQRAATAAASAGVETISVETIEKRWPGMTEPQQLASINQLIAKGHYVLARKLLDSFVAVGPPGRRVAELLDAKLLRAEGKLEDAERVYKKVVAEAPDFRAARFELAQTMFQLKQDDLARQQFLFLLASGSGDDQRDAIRQFMSVMDERRTLSLSAVTGVTATTNLAQRSDPLNGASSKPSAGAFAGAVARLNLPIADQLDFVAAGAAIGTGYKDITNNDLSLNLEAGPRRTFDWGYIGLFGTVAKRWIGEDPSVFSYGARLATMVRLGDSDRVTLSTPCQRNHWGPTTDRDGWTCGAQATLDHQLSPDAFVRALGGVERTKTEADGLGYVARNGGFGVGYNFAKDWSFYAQALYTKRDYDGFDPTYGVDRRDNRVDLSAQITTTQWDVLGLTPSLRYTYTLNHSGIGDYSFHAHGVSFTLTTQF